MNATEREVELRRLSNDIKANIYEATKLAAEMLADAEWIAQQHDGRQELAYDYLEDKYFAFFGAAWPLQSFLEIYKAFPERDQWAKWKFHLDALLHEARLILRGREERRTRRTATLAEVAEKTHEADAWRRTAQKALEGDAKAVVQHVQSELKQKTQDVEKKTNEVKRLRSVIQEVTKQAEANKLDAVALQERVEELEKENAKLKGIIASLRKQLDSVYVEAA